MLLVPSPKVFIDPDIYFSKTIFLIINFSVTVPAKTKPKSLTFML